MFVVVLQTVARQQYNQQQFQQQQTFNAQLRPDDVTKRPPMHPQHVTDDVRNSQITFQQQQQHHNHHDYQQPQQQAVGPTTTRVDVHYNRVSDVSSRSMEHTHQSVRTTVRSPSVPLHRASPALTIGSNRSADFQSPLAVQPVSQARQSPYRPHAGTFSLVGDFTKFWQFYCHNSNEF